MRPYRSPALPAQQHAVTLLAKMTLAAAIVAVLGAPARAQSGASLKGAFASSFRVGAAMNASQLADTSADGALVARQFNSITPENLLKWQSIEPRPNEFNFGPADRFVAFGERHGMQIIGHTLVWHGQTPRWVFQDAAGGPASRDSLLARMRSHIRAVMGRYKGRIHGWDVVNEALNDDGTLRQSPWLRIIGEDYIAKAFQFAHEVDPAAELYYNDFDLDYAPKRAGAVRLVQSLLAQGVPLSGVGLQGHYKLERPSLAEIDSTIGGFARLGVKVNITELDIDVLPRAAKDGAEVGTRIPYQAALDPYRDSLPSAMQDALATRYADLFRIYVKHRDAISRVTFWGVTDRTTWLNNYPMPGRSNHPLLFDRQRQPKRAFDAVLRAATEKPRA
jgi:endo-1,4-beta-xylanase